MNESITTDKGVFPLASHELADLAEWLGNTKDLSFHTDSSGRVHVIANDEAMRLRRQDNGRLVVFDADEDFWQTYKGLERKLI